MASLGHFPRAPVEKLISGFEMQSRRTKRQRTNPLSLVLGDVTQDLANGIRVAKVVFPLHELIVPFPFSRLDQAHRNFLE
jgi:hypothetical protein